MRGSIGLILTLAMTGTAGAQGRGRGAVPGGGAPGGSIEHVIVHGKALEGNREGDSPDRNLTIYLPPNYANDPARRFPVIYFLPDFQEPSDDVINGIKNAADKPSPVQGFSEPIVVALDANTSRKESMYGSSPAAGDWERFIADDLVGYVDSHYRTLSKRISRGLAGHSMGAYGALRIGMKRPDVFSSLYLMSACCLTETNSTLEQNSNLMNHYGIAIEIGDGDASLAANRQLHEAMMSLHVRHSYQEYEGNHTSKAGERFERNLLPFFSKNLAAPANPTSPAVQ